MDANTYNQTRLDNGNITTNDITLLTREYQKNCKTTLQVDGKLGDKTLAALRGTNVGHNPRVSYDAPKFERVYPMPNYQGRPALVSSDHWLVNKSRAPGSHKNSDGSLYQGHQGQDYMYTYIPGTDPPKRELKSSRYDGSWWVPVGISVLSVAAGKVVRASWQVTTKEWVVAVEHLGGWVTLYRHLETCTVRGGDRVLCGQALGLAGAATYGLVHLHFEVYRPGTFRGAADYDYTDSQWPTPFLEGAGRV